MSQKAKLIILTGSKQNSEVEISDSTFQLGRSDDNDLLIEDQLASRHHAQITREENDFYIADLDTPNGTYINQKRIRNQKLHSGDVIQVGSQLYRFIMSHSMVQPSLASGSTPPQHEKITSHEMIKRNRRKPLVLGLALLFVGMLTLLLLPSQKKPTISPQLEVQVLHPHLNTPIDSEGLAANQEKANRFFESGYRELIAKNYARALDDFRTALQLYPEHALAKLYTQKAEEMIKEDVDKHYKAGVNYFNSAQYQLAIYHFRQVKILLDKNKPSETYCSVKEERNVASENKDYEKYCDADRKITEAQELLSQ